MTIDYLNESLVADWIEREMVANEIVERGAGGLVLRGDKNQFYVEVKVFKIAPDSRTRRLTEEDDLGYN